MKQYTQYLLLNIVIGIGPWLMLLVYSLSVSEIPSWEQTTSLLGLASVLAGVVSGIVWNEIAMGLSHYIVYGSWDRTHPKL